MAISALLDPFARLVGRWTTEATHPAMPGLIVHGTVDIEWLEGNHFLLHRSRCDHPDFPDSLWVIGNDQQDRADDQAPAPPPTIGVAAHYFDSRGVFRRFETSIDDTAWRWWRDAPDFAQRFTGTFAEEGRTIVGQSELNGADDLAVTYRRVPLE